MEREVGMEFPSLEFSHEMEDESLTDDEKIIKSFLAKGISIPSCISKICRVQK